MTEHYAIHPAYEYFGYLVNGGAVFVDSDFFDLWPAATKELKRLIDNHFEKCEWGFVRIEDGTIDEKTTLIRVGGFRKKQTKEDPWHGLGERG
jgi:hypothetical protein